MVCMTWKLSYTKIMGIAAVALGVACLLALSWKSLMERAEEATMKDELDPTQLENRAQYFALAGAILQDKVLGVGLNNWSYHVSKTYGGRIVPPCNYEDYDDIPPSVLYSAEIFDWSAKYAPPAHNPPGFSIEHAMPRSSTARAVAGRSRWRSKTKANSTRSLASSVSASG